MTTKEYSPLEIDDFFRNDDLSILLKLPDDFFDIAKARSFIQRFPYHTVSIYAFCEADVRANPMVIQAALPGLAKARRMDMLPEKIRNNPQIMIRAITATTEAYFQLPEHLKEDLPFHLELSEKVENLLELPISPAILANAKFIYNCVEGTLAPYVKNQILNSNIPDNMKNQILCETRHFLYEKNVSLEFIKEQVLKVLETLVIEQSAMAHNLSPVDLSHKFRPKLTAKNPQADNSLFQPFSPSAQQVTNRKKQDKLVQE